MVTIAFFLLVAAIVIGPQYLRMRERERLHETLRQAYAAGQPPPADLLEALQATRQSRPNPTPVDPVGRDLRLGVIWLSIGVALVLIGGAFYAMLYSQGGAVETLCSFAAIAAVPACVGLAFLLLFWLGRKRI